MPRKSTHPAPGSVDADFQVFGTVLDAFQRPLKGATVEVFDQLLRDEKRLGKPAKTDQTGAYRVIYEPSALTHAEKGAADVVVRVFEDKKLLKQSDVVYNAAPRQEVNVNLSPAPYPGPSELERALETVRPLLDRVPLATLTEDASHADITFLTGKTSLTRQVVSALAMAFRFEKSTGVEAAAYYGLLRQGPAQQAMLQVATQAPTLSFDDQAAQAFGALMSEPLESLMQGIQGAIASNLVPYAVNARTAAIQKGLTAAQAAYQKAHPPPANPPTLTQKLEIAGLQGSQVSTVVGLFKSGGATQDFWKALSQNPSFQAQQVSMLQAVFTLSQLTGEQMVLTDQLVKATQVQTPADLAKLAANTSQAWLSLLQKNSIQPPAGTPGANPTAQLQNYATELEANFTAAFPSVAFQARLAADAQTRVPQGPAIAQFLQANPTFDLLTTRVGQFLAPTPASTALANPLKRMQRIFKLAPTYAAANALVGDGLDSAQKIYRKGPGNFVAQYGPSLGEPVARDIFLKARQAYSQALMLVGNLKSMSDASALSVFPNYTEILSGAMTVEVPDLDTLFGHTDFCECDECNSVEGAPAYLADALHYLDNRLTNITSGTTTASVKQALLVRRQDVADLDLSCDNTNVEVPYIDLANEQMEGAVAPPVVSVASTFLPKLVQGTIDPTLQAAIASALNAAGFTNVAALFTANATVSSSYSVTRLQSGGTFATENHWILRDQFVVLKATQQAAAIAVQLTQQTLLSQDEISANPEYTNIPAYNALKAAKRPFALPFDLFESEGEAYLAKLGTKKPDLIDAFRPEHQPAVIGLPAYPLSPAPTQADLEMAYAYLGVIEGERSLIFQQDLAGQATYWGPLAGGTSAPLDQFMAATSLSYEQVLELLALKTVNPLQDSLISSADLSCDTHTKTITLLTPTKFDIIHRFLRLWRKTTLSLYELDAIVQSAALGAGAIGPALAPQLQAFLTLQGLWSLTAFQLLAFFQNLDTQAPGDLYESLFQNRAVTNPLNADFAVSQVTSATPLALSAVHQSLIMGALGLAPQDLTALVGQTDGKLSLRNLSYFFRMAQLSQALSVSLPDLSTFFALINVPPVTFAVATPTPPNPVSSDPIAASQFVLRWRAVISSQLAASDLDYVLRYQNDPGAALVPSDDDIAQALADLQSKLLQVQAATQVVADPQGQLLKKWLTDPLLGWNASLVSKLLDILGTQDDVEFQQKVDNNDDFLTNLRIQYLDGTLTAALAALPGGVVIPDALTSQVSYDAANRQLVLVGNISAADQATLNGLSADPAYQAAINQLFNAQTTPSSAGNVVFANLAAINANLRPLLQAQLPQRYAYFLNAIAPVYQTLQQQDALQKELCAWFKINKDIAAALEASQPGIYTDLTSTPFVTRASALTAANYSAQFSWYRKIALVCFLVSKLKLTAEDLTWLFPNAAKVGSLDLWNLPTTAIAGPATTFGAFQVLVQILTFTQQFPQVTQVTPVSTTQISLYSIFSEVLAAAALPQVEADLSALTGWDAGSLEQLIHAPNALGLTLTPANTSDLLSARILLRLARCFQVMKGLGAATADCVSWIKPSLTYGDAQKVKQALQAQTGPDQWESVTQPLQDTLRQAKRDALVAYLLTNPLPGQSWQTTDDLYSYFLIDVEMTACQPTSRIVQATNTVQQFVQRCFLNLETSITVDLEADPDWTQWEWMKNYRVWQANREVFLYPENYIQPELLPDEIKSPFLKDLENNLLQNDVTQDAVESAFLTYLDSLDEVSRLEIKAMWYEDAKQILHVVGRTYGGDPKTYYYRQLIEDRRWTPWVKIDQDVASDHVVLTVFNHRVYLFWALFQENSNNVTSVSVPSPGDSSYTPDQPPKYWQIQLAFSEYKNGKWTAKKVSKGDPTGTLTYDESWDGSSWSPTKDQFLFTPLDIPQLHFDKLLGTNGAVKDANTFFATLRQDVIDALENNGDLLIRCYLQPSPGVYWQVGAFELDACKGYPVVADNSFPLHLTLFDQSSLSNMLDLGNQATESLAVNGWKILNQTVGRFDNLVPMQMGFIDRLINIIYQILYGLYYQRNAFASEGGDRIPVTVGTFMPYVYQDKSYTYYVRPEFSDNADFEFAYQDLENLLLALLEGNTTQVHEILATFPRDGKISLMQHYFNLFHPLVCFFMRTLFDSGMDSLMSRQTQLKNDVLFDPSPDFDFGTTFRPTPVVYSGQPVTYTLPSGTVTDQTPGYPKGDVDFTPEGGYSLYNWELFFHAPLMIAKRLDQNLQFEDADHWFKYIFNPTDGSTYPSPDKYWVTKPFFENVNDKYTQQNINNIMQGIDAKNQPLLKDVKDWRNNPFQPHYIAQYRTVAYQKTTVMNYLDHLIAWGDSLFQQDTMESVMEAEQLYVLASQILGPKPLIIPPAYQLPIENYDQLQQNIDAFSNALVDVENLLPLQEIQGYTGVNPQQGMPVLATLYFCVPPNTQLLAYWDTVADRLFKIRNCLNLQGQLAPLALFAPPINPMLLVRAAAAGLDIGSVLSDLNSPLPNYRFSGVLQKSLEICNEAKSLGSALLQAMEKKDAEDLALLRSKNGVALLQAVLTLKQMQATEAGHSLEALQAQQALIQVRINYYQGLINTGLSSGETASLNMTQSAIGQDQAAVSIEYLGNILALIPDFDLGASGFGGSPLAAVKFGGTQLGGATRAMASAIRGTAGVIHSQAGVANTQAGYQRRLADWQFQLSLANAELAQVLKQILAAQVRQDIANQDVQNQQLQITNAQAEDDFLHQKFTSTDLYAYMISQLSELYFQGYQLAYAWAKQAEQTFRYELGLSDSGFITFGYWDSLHKGLLAADSLLSSIRSMDKAYHDQNAREYELTKHVSLAQLDPAALEQLKATGSCWFSLPEELFDLDYPGHYMRRLRSVSMTLPCVAGPYTTVSCKLTMTRNSVRVSPTSTGPGTYPRKQVSGAPADDPRFRDAVGAIQAIATSNAQNDSGLFEMSFRDERYLPFECAGAISQWHLELPAPYPQFDYGTVTDAIVHLKYTARDAGAQLAQDAATSLKTRLNAMVVGLKATDSGLMRGFSVRHEFPTQWYAFLNPPSAGADQELDLEITADRFPYFASVLNLKIQSIEVIADTALTAIHAVTVTPAPTNAPPLNLIQDNAYGTLPRLVLKYSGQAPGTWVLKNPVANPRLTRDQLNDLILIVHYQVS